MNIVALDVATRCGVAVGRPQAAPRAWSEHLGETDDARFAQALRLTDRLIREHRPEVVVVEAAIGGEKASHLLIGLVACVRGACTARGVEVESANIGAARKHFIGQHITSASTAFRHLRSQSARKAAARKAAKEAVMNRCRALGWPVRNDDEADAVALWDYAASRRSHAHAVMTAGGLWT